MSLNTPFSPDPDKLAQLTGRGAAVVVLPTYAAALTIDSNAGLFQKIVTTAAIGNSTVACGQVGKFGQQLVLEFANDATAARTITFGTNFRSNSTIVGTESKSIIITFVSDGTVFKEMARSGAAV